MKRLLGLLTLTTCLSLACGRDLGGTGSDTNWLRACDDDAECGDLSCVCGVCTLECSSDSTCNRYGALECLSASALAACSGSSVPAGGICVAACDDSDAVCDPLSPNGSLTSPSSDVQTSETSTSSPSPTSSSPDAGAPRARGQVSAPAQLSEQQTQSVDAGLSGGAVAMSSPAAADAGLGEIVVGPEPTEVLHCVEPDPLPAPPSEPVDDPVQHAGTWTGFIPLTTFPSGSDAVTLVVHDDGTGWIVFGDASLETTTQDIVESVQMKAEEGFGSSFPTGVVEGYRYALENAGTVDARLAFELDQRRYLDPLCRLLDTDGSIDECEWSCPWELQRLGGGQGNQNDCYSVTGGVRYYYSCVKSRLCGLITSGGPLCECVDDHCGHRPGMSSYEAVLELDGTLTLYGYEDAQARLTRQAAP